MKAQTEWAFAFWMNRPAIWCEVSAFSFEQGQWISANSSEVGMDGRMRTKTFLEKEFGPLPDVPPFPFEEVTVALQLEQKRLSAIHTPAKRSS